MGAAGIDELLDFGGLRLFEFKEPATAPALSCLYPIIISRVGYVYAWCFLA